MALAPFFVASVALWLPSTSSMSVRSVVCCIGNALVYSEVRCADQCFGSTWHRQAVAYLITRCCKRCQMTCAFPLGHGCSGLIHVNSKVQVCCARRASARCALVFRLVWVMQQLCCSWGGCPGTILLQLRVLVHCCQVSASHQNVYHAPFTFACIVVYAQPRLTLASPQSEMPSGACSVGLPSRRLRKAAPVYVALAQLHGG